MKLPARSLVLAMGLALLLVGLQPSSAVGAELIYTADFEGGSLSPLSPSGNSPTVQNSFTRNGKQAMKTYLNRLTSATSYRTEVSVSRDNCAVIGQEYWYGFSIYLPGPYAHDELDETVAQWHHVKDQETTDGAIVDTTHNPPVALSIDNGEWRLKVRWAATQPTLAADMKGVALPLGPQSTDKWTDWVFRIKWAYDDSGILQVWKNGVLVVNRNGPNTYNDIKGPWFKMGIYKSLWNAAKFDPRQSNHRTHAVSRRAANSARFRWL